MTVGYLLDTNILSETRKVRANENVLAFLAGQAPSRLFVSALSIGELRKGIAFEKRRDARKALQIESWVDATEATFADRILPIDTIIARRWGEAAAGRSRPVVDTLIAATAVVHDLTLATRNLADMRDMGVRLFNPFEDRPA